MMSTSIASVGLLVAVWIGSAWALTGNDLDLAGKDFDVHAAVANPSPTAWGEAIKETQRVTYVRAILDMALASYPTPICFPQGSTPWQAYQVVKAYARRNPQELHKVGWHIVMQAFVEAWSCPATPR